MANEGEKVRVTKIVDDKSRLITIGQDLGYGTNFVEICHKTQEYSDNREPTEHVGLAIGWKAEDKDTGKVEKKYKKSFLVPISKFSKTKFEMIGYSIAFVSGAISREQFDALIQELKNAPKEEEETEAEPEEEEDPGEEL